MKKVSMALYLTAIVFGSFSTSDAWYIGIENVGQNATYPTWYTADLVWHPDGYERNLNAMCLAVTWDSGASLDAIPVVIETHKVGRATVWEDIGLSYGIDGNILYDIVGAEPIGKTLDFIPADGTLLAQVWWLGDPGDVSFTSYLISGSETVMIQVDDFLYLLGENIGISFDGSKIGYPLPWPGDYDFDGDVDGSDLAAYAAGLDFNLTAFADSFGIVYF